MEYSGAGGKLIHEINQKQKISWHCPFKAELRDWTNLETGGKVGKWAGLSGSSPLAEALPLPLPPARRAMPTRLAELGGSSNILSVAL